MRSAQFPDLFHSTIFYRNDPNDFISIEKPHCCAVSLTDGAAWQTVGLVLLYSTNCGYAAFSGIAETIKHYKNAIPGI